MVATPSPQGEAAKPARTPRWSRVAMPKFWQLNLAVWAVFGILVFCVRWIFHGDVLPALVFTAVVESAACLITMLLHPLYRRWDFELRTAVFIAAASFLAAVALSVLAHLVAEITGWHFAAFTRIENAMLRVLLTWMVFMAWSFAYFWLKAEGALRDRTLVAGEAVREAQKMELRMLRSQLDPHFLFNSLNGIAAEIPVHPDAAADMVRELAGYLRYSLEHRNQAIAPLSSELEAMRAYLAVEKARFGDLLFAEVGATPEAGITPVPGFLLQPLVENAIKHGSLARGEPMVLSLRAWRSGKTLGIQVVNTGSLPAGAVGEGVGLDTLRRRLALHYPGRHRLQIAARDSQVIAALSLEGDPCCG